MTGKLHSLEIDWETEDYMLGTFLSELNWPVKGLRKLTLHTITPEFEIDLSELHCLTDFELTVFRNSTLQSFDKVDFIMPED